MVTQNIQPEAASFLNLNANPGTPKISESGFNQIMNKSLGTSQDKISSKSGKTDNKSLTSTTYSQQQSNLITKDSVVQENALKVSDSIGTTPATKALNELSEEDFVKMEEILAVLNIKIFDIVKQVLDITEDELNKAISDLGMEITDLMNPNNLKDLVLYVNGEVDDSQLLTNEGLSVKLTELIQKIDDIDMKPDYDLTKEELATLVNIMSDIQNYNVLNQSNEKPNDVIVNQMQEESQEPHISITVEAETNEPTYQQQSTDSLNGRDQTLDSKKESKSEKLDSFIQNLAGVTTQNVEELSEQALSKINQMKEIVTQVVDQIKILIKPDMTSMEIQLNPENLGKVNLSVVVKNGQITANFVTENQLSKEALESQLQILKENLNNQGLKVDAIEVTVSNFGFNQSSNTNTGNQQQKSNAKRSINLNDSKYMEDDLSEAELLAAKVLEQSGGSVDYTV